MSRRVDDLTNSPNRRAFWLGLLGGRPLSPEGRERLKREFPLTEEEFPLTEEELLELERRYAGSRRDDA